MEKEVIQDARRDLYLALLGCGVITLGSLIRIPYQPVPFTLQTLALFILALTQSPKQAFASSICYLLCATIGLPVLGGKINFLWMTGKCGGYLLAFPIASYLMARLAQKWPPLFSLICGQVVIFTLGWIWLIPFLGVKAAFTKGVLIFIPSGFFKMFAAIAYVKWRNR